MEHEQFDFLRRDYKKNIMKKDTCSPRSLGPHRVGGDGSSRNKSPDGGDLTGDQSHETQQFQSQREPGDARCRLLGQCRMPTSNLQEK